MSIETSYIIKNSEGRRIAGFAAQIQRGYEGKLASQLLDQWPKARSIRWENAEAFGAIQWGEATSETEIQRAQDEFDDRSRLA